MLKKRSVLLVLFLLSCLLFSCKKTTDYSKIRSGAPDMGQAPAKYEIDFVEMHNFVIESLQSRLTPYYFIVNGKFDISGDNEKKEIVVKCTCLNGSTTQDVDLFFSDVLNLMAFNASEQNYKYKVPSTSSDGTYMDFGTFFNDFDLRLYADTESSEILRDTYVKRGETIPIDPRYMMEE